MGEQVLTNLGDSPESADKVIRQFLDYDDKLLLEQFAVHDSEEKLIQTARDRNEELERLLREDLEH
jgi:glutathione-regulated potassium-efflux system protein KefB